VLPHDFNEVVLKFRHHDASFLSAPPFLRTRPAA
jgi:hypothetical protein